MTTSITKSTTTLGNIDNRRLDLDLNGRADRYQLKAERSTTVKETDGSDTVDATFDIEGTEQSTLNKPSFASRQFAVGFAAHREARARAHFEQQAGITTGDNVQRRTTIDNGSRTVSYTGDFNNDGKQDRAQWSYSGQAQNRLNGNWEGKATYQGSVTYADVDKRDINNLRPDWQLSPLATNSDGTIGSDAEAGISSRTTRSLEGPDLNSDGTSLSRTQRSNFENSGQYTPAGANTKIELGVQSDKLPELRDQAKDNLTELGIDASVAKNFGGPANDHFFGPESEKLFGAEETLRNLHNQGVEFDTDALNKAIGSKDFDLETFNENIGDYVSDWGDGVAGKDIQLSNGQSVKVPEGTESASSSSSLEPGIHFEDGVLTVQGTGEGDDIRMRKDGDYYEIRHDRFSSDNEELGSAIRRIRADEVDKVRIFAGDGNDRVFNGYKDERGRRQEGIEGAYISMSGLEGGDKNQVVNYADEATIALGSRSDGGVVNNYGDRAAIIDSAGDDAIYNEGEGVHMRAGGGDTVQNLGDDARILVGGGRPEAADIASVADGVHVEFENWRADNGVVVGDDVSTNSDWMDDVRSGTRREYARNFSGSARAMERRMRQSGRQTETSPFDKS